jgi:uncharacterized protein YcfJ
MHQVRVVGVTRPVRRVVRPGRRLDNVDGQHRRVVEDNHLHVHGALDGALHGACMVQNHTKRGSMAGEMAGEKRNPPQ